MDPTLTYQKLRMAEHVQYKPSVKRYRVLLLVLTLAVPMCKCLEEPEPEVLLPPRNFNPHPYQAGYDPRTTTNGNTGPVLFPETPPDLTANGYTGNGVTNVIDTHPYATVARRKKYKQAGRWRSEEDQVNPNVYKALAQHGAKVLSIPPSGLKDGYLDTSLTNEKKNYKFSYKVVDNLHGDDFSHTQSQDGRATNGEYRVKLPDGRVQIVSYTADKNGYKADVKYTEKVDDGIKSYFGRPLQATNERDYFNPDSQYVYYKVPNHAYNPSPQNHQPNYIYRSKEATPIEENAYDHHRDQVEYVSATPGYRETLVEPNAELIFSNKFQVVPEQKVQVLADIHGGQKVGKYIGASLPVYTLDSSKGFRGNVVSTLAPNLDDYGPLYVNPTKFSYVNRYRRQESTRKK